MAQPIATRRTPQQSDHQYENIHPTIPPPDIRQRGHPCFVELRTGQNLIEDDFTKSASANIADRQPTKGPAWEGTARIDERVGLIASEAQSNSAAFADVNVPEEFKKLTVKIRYRSGSEQQLGFGFANSDKALRDSKGKNNMGLMWVNTMAKRATVNAGKYANGEKIEINITDALELRSQSIPRNFSCQHCGKPVRPHQAASNGASRAHFEHLEKNPDCFFGRRNWNGIIAKI